MEKRSLFGIILVLGIFLGILGFQSSSALLVQCDGIYALNISLYKTISTDEQAFNELKNYWTVYDSSQGYWIEDAIPSDMTVQQAIEQGILNVNQTITLDRDQNITGTWIIYQLKAIDKQGNVYFCDNPASDPGSLESRTTEEKNISWFNQFINSIGLFFKNLFS